jgi:hypothetical protein
MTGHAIGVGRLARQSVRRLTLLKEFFADRKSLIYCRSIPYHVTSNEQARA